MRVNLDSLSKSKRVSLESILVDVVTERQVLVAWIAECGAFEYFADVELDDFTDPRCRAVLIAIRSLPNRAEDVHFSSVIGVLERRDRERETHIVDKVLWWLADLICDGEWAPAYQGRWEILQSNLAWLRELNHRRRAA